MRLGHNNEWEEELYVSRRGGRGRVEGGTVRIPLLNSDPYIYGCTSPIYVIKRDENRRDRGRKAKPSLKRDETGPPP